MGVQEQQGVSDHELKKRIKNATNIIARRPRRLHAVKPKEIDYGERYFRACENPNVTAEQRRTLLDDFIANPFVTGGFDDGDDDE